MGYHRGGGAMSVCRLFSLCGGCKSATQSTSASPVLFQPIYKSSFYRIFYFSMTLLCKLCFIRGVGYREGADIDALSTFCNSFFLQSTISNSLFFSNSQHCQFFVYYKFNLSRISRNRKCKTPFSIIV